MFPESLTITQIWAVFITGLVLGIITLFKNEIINFISTWISDRKLYKNRRVDSDGDPSTGQFCPVRDPASGELYVVWLEEYTWSHFDSFNRLARLKWPFDLDKGLWFETAMPYIAWRQWLTGYMPKKQKIVVNEKGIPELIEDKISEAIPIKDLLL
jgi:hypothetical protein